MRAYFAGAGSFASSAFAAAEPDGEGHVLRSAAIDSRIARTIRFSSGGFRYVKAMGVMLASRSLAQVSMNLTDFEQTPLHLVFETVRREAKRYGAAVVGSEIVGLIPKKALEQAAEYFIRCENFRPEIVFENKLAEAVTGGGLNEFLDSLAASTPAPGGGSAAAAAGAMAAALGAMVSGLAKFDGASFDADRQFLAAAVERDAAAFGEVMTAYRMPKAERPPHVEAALQKAATVPMEVAERVFDLDARLEELARETPQRFSSDLATARALAAAAIQGALANVVINLGSIAEDGFRRDFEARVARIQK